MVRPGGGRMAEDHRKQNVSRTWRASPSGISACFPENPTGRLLRNHSRFHGVVSADPAGLFRAEGELRQILGDGSAKVFCAKSPAAHGKGPPPRLLSRDGPAFALGRRQDARHTDRFRQKVEADSGHWEKRLCHLQTHTIDLYYAHGKEWARLHPTPDRPGKTIPCRR